ncbi:vitellogenin-like isoform X2 [Vespula pensylvanica]|uniref:vitellogenin-like isoform X2 n=1 Tax=Vespula pensylvanica TaxID=30213 RepID=UPI001CBA454D|nr:vitellogenin-like isoform X2 [Vespula pensylvanica]
MSITDNNFVKYFLAWKLRRIFVIILLCSIQPIYGLFTPEKEYRYLYNATSSSGVLLPSSATSSWGLNGILIIQARENVAVMQFQSLKMNIWNGKIGEKGEDIDINESAEDLLMPFEVTYKMGLVENFTIQNEPVWVTNIKRSIVGILQLDLSTIEKEAAFHSMEINHYGQCNIEYVVSSENDNEKIIRKSLDPRTCIGQPFRFWTNVPRMQCPHSEQDPILKSSERLYYVRYNNTVQDILYINATGGIYVQPFQSFGEAHFYFSRQNLRLITVQDTVNQISLYNPHTVTLQHELPEEDLTQGRGVLDKDSIFKVIGNLLDRLSQTLETPGLDTETNNLHNTTISILLYYLGMLDRTDLEIAYNNISGTSYKEETIRNMFLEALPQIGSKDSALFIFDLIQSHKVSDIIAIQLLTQLPFHIRKPDVQLLVTLRPLLSLEREISTEIQNTAILSYGTLIYKICLVYCSYEILDDYVRFYLDKFTESTEYEKKMIWLEGLANIQLGRVVEFLESIASGKNAESRHFRVLAAWASLPSAPLRPEIIYPVYWPMLVNKTEHLEMRIAALTLLIVSNPTPSRLISLYWYMKTEPNLHLYNYFYTTLKSMEQTTYPCYLHMGSIAAQFTRVLRKPSNNKLLLTGNYLFDYKDTYRKFGAMLHGIVIANPATNIPEAMYVTLNNYGSGTTINHVSLYIKAEGLLHSLSTYLENPTQVKDILNQYKLDRKEIAPVHLEIIAQVQQKTVLCLHLNHTNIAKIVQYLASLPDNIYQIYQNTEFHINQQRINIPITMESVQVTDMGTNVRLSMTATSLFSMRGNFIHSDIGRNNHVILRTSIHGSEIIENYNPLVDLWHAAERAQSIHGYLPINITIGLDERPFITYNTPGEHFKMGVVAHVRTVTHIRGTKTQTKLKAICPNCPISYTVRRELPINKLKTINLFEFGFPELGGKVLTKLFDCESAISREKVITDILSSHQANYQIWPGMKIVLAAVHLLDYFTYVPPKGSCGLTVYVEPFDALVQTQVKFEYVKNNRHHMISLTNRELNSQRVLYQWNLAALYDTTSWISDSLKIKATKITSDEKIMKFCIEADREMDWEWDFLNVNPPSPSKLKLVLVWGPSDTAKGKCSGSSIILNLVGEVSKAQVEESQKEKWPYDQCRKELKKRNYVPYTDTCYEASKELSILRKYQFFFNYENLPEPLSKIVWKLRAVYELFGGNSNYTNNSGQFLLSAVFPKNSDSSELELDSNKAR